MNRLIVCISLVFVTLSLTTIVFAGQQVATASESSVAILSESQLAQSVIDHSGTALYYPRTLGTGAWYVRRNNESVSRRFNGVCNGKLVVSPTGKWFAAIAKVNDKQQVVSSDTTGELYDAILAEKLLFAPDGSQVYYAAQANGKWYAVIDVYGNNTLVSKPYDQIRADSMTVSPDGRYFAFAALLGDKWGAIIMDRLQGRVPPGTPSLRTEETRYSDVGSIAFTPDSKDVIYTVRVDGKWHVILHGRALRPYEAIGSLVTSQDGVTSVFSVKQDTRWHLAKYAPIQVTKRVDNRGVDRGNAIVSAEYAPGKAYDELGEPVISPDSSRIAVAARVGNAWQMVETPCLGTDEVTSIAYEAIGTPIFSADGKHLVYPAKTNGKWGIIYDGKPLGPLVDALGMPKLSPDGSRVLVSVRQGQQWAVMMDGVIGPTYENIGAYTFSMDGNHVAYVVVNDRGAWAIADDRPIGPFAGILHDAVYIDGPTSFHVFCYRKSTDANHGKNEFSIGRVDISYR